jgi:hypothetical protein
MLEPLKVACEGGDGLAAKVTCDDLAEGWGFCAGGDSLAPILTQHMEAIMNQIPYHHCLQAAVQAWLDAEHLQPSYWLACYNRQTGEVLWLRGVDSHNPTRIQRLVPIEPLHECALIEVSYDRTFKWIGGPYSVLDP